MSDVDVRTRSREEVLYAYKIEYDDQMANWRALDAKAQGAVAIAGIFIGGLLALANGSSTGPSSTPLMPLAFALASLLMAVLAAVRVLWVREVVDPPSGTAVAVLAVDLQSLEPADALSIERYHGYLGDRATLWQQTILETRRGNDRKASALRVAQVCLVISVLIVGGSTLWRLIAA
jgi:hypothetical protein